MSYTVGKYQGFECYQLESGEVVPETPGAIYIDDKGNMHYGGVRIGRVALSNYSVKEFDMGIYEAKMRAKRTREKEVAVPASVAAATEKTADLTIGQEVDLTGTDEFFARLALDIEETLKGVKDFNG